MAIIAADIQWRKGAPYSTLFNEFYISPSNETEQNESEFLQLGDFKRRWQGLSKHCASFTMLKLALAQASISFRALIYG